MDRDVGGRGGGGSDYGLALVLKNYVYGLSVGFRESLWFLTIFMISWDFSQISNIFLRSKNKEVLEASIIQTLELVFEGLRHNTIWVIVIATYSVSEVSENYEELSRGDKSYGVKNARCANPRNTWQLTQSFWKNEWITRIIKIS